MFHMEQSTRKSVSFCGSIDTFGHGGGEMFHVEQFFSSMATLLPFHEKRGKGLSLPCDRVFDQSIEATWSLGGVPVFSRNSSNPNDLRDSERGAPPGRPAPPLAWDSCPMKTKPFKAVPAVMTTVFAISCPCEIVCMPMTCLLAESVMTDAHSSCRSVRLGWLKRTV